MKKLFTLFAFLTLFMGAKAANWVEVYSIDYANNTGFPFYVMGYVPEWYDGVMTDFGANYKYVQVTDDAEETSDVIVKTQGGVEYYKIEVPEGAWHQYFIADGIPTQLDGTYKAVAMVRASAAVTINVNMGWGWGDGQQASASVAIGTEWQEVEWEYSGIGGASCNLVAQPGGATATIEWKYVKVFEDQREQRPVIWQEWLTSDGQPIIPDVAHDNKWMGDAETPWGDLADVKFNDQSKNYLICAWGKERMVNVNEDGGWDPVPATIEQEANGNHYFIVHGKEAITEGDAAAWDNQFWIQSPKAWASGTQVKVHFRYKASKAVTVATQIHKQNPSDYLIWHACGDVSFTEEWQDFDNTMTIADDMAGGWSIAFQLNQNDKDAIDFYFDDLSWQTMKLDEGLFVAGSNTTTGLEYDFDNAIQFEYSEDVEAMVATIGEKDKKDTWVNQIMISTVRGNDAAFKGATLKPTGEYIGEDAWGDFTETALSKINLPAQGVWTIAVDQEAKQINIVMVVGEEVVLPEINPNPYVVVVEGVERDDLSDQTNQQTGEVTIREEEGGTGEAWDNQFWIYANRQLATGEVTVLQFKYKANKAARTSTQCHGEPGAYMHWAAIGDVNFTEEWQDFEQTFTVPSEANNMKSIAFNMAEIKEACTYELKDFVWKLEDGTESLIDQKGSKNFFVKIGAGTSPYSLGINSVTVNNKVSNVIYNLSGQRVSKDYKGIVVKNGKKILVQ